MGLEIAVPVHGKLGEGFSRRERLRALEHPGRRSDGVQTAATWITDLMALRKAILLCSFCRPKFNPRKHGYRKFYSPDWTGKTDGYMSNGRCDGCKQNTALLAGGGTTFISEDTYRLVCIDPLDARRVARAEARSLTAWGRIATWWGSARPCEARALKGA